MNFRRLLLRNLTYHWRGNLAVLLGIAVGTAVLAGALLVGDSLRGSLRAQSERQLAGVDYALVGGRFFRAELAGELTASRVVPVILLGGTASPADEPEPVKVTIFGVDERFWADRGPMPGPAGRWNSAEEVAALPASVARELKVIEGDFIELRVQKVSAVPRESPLGERRPDKVSEGFDVQVAAVVPDDHPAVPFSLRPNPGVPRNVFVPLGMLQRAVDQPGRANGLLASGGTLDGLQKELADRLTVDDWGLIVLDGPERAARLFERLDRNKDGRLRPNEWKGRIALAAARGMDKDGDQTLTRPEVDGWYKNYPVTLESQRLLIEPSAALATLELLEGYPRRGLQRVMVYLANGISHGDKTIPYSVVAAVEPFRAEIPGLIPALGGVSDDFPIEVGKDEIVLVDWKDSPFQARKGDPITITYFKPEIEGRIVQASETFRLTRVVPLERPFLDPEITPDFPGITDKLSIGQWDPPFPYDNSRIKPADEKYWEEYRTTPKAYIPLNTGSELWGSRFGSLTSIRFAQFESAPMLTAAGFRRLLTVKLDPKAGGLVFDPVRDRLLGASRGGTDFGGLFLGFSSFLIGAALILVGLLVRLNLERRASEIGVLVATGYRVRAVRRLLLGEGLALAAVGGVIGLAGAVGYAALMLKLLVSLWPTGQAGSVLRLYVEPQSLVIGFASAVVLSGLTIAWAVRVLNRVAPSALIAGETTPAADPAGPRHVRGRWSVRLAVGCAVAAVGLAVAGPFVNNPEARAGTFFGSGALLLTAGLAIVWAWLRRERHAAVHGVGPAAVARLGVRNATRNPLRSLLTAAMLASAAFLLVAVESFRRQPESDFLAKAGGSGGFALVAESDVPLYEDLNSEQGRAEVFDAVERSASGRGDPKQARADAEAVLRGVTVFPLRLRAGDDASCLNLYQATRPRLLGVPHALVERGGFQFTETEASTPEEEANPWLVLEKPRADGAVPVFGEANTLTYMLKVGLGDTIEVPDENAEVRKLHIAGVLKDSVFQSELLMGEKAFVGMYARQEGYQVFLIDAGGQPPDRVASLLRAGLRNRGFDVERSDAKLAAYLAVQNTYLSTFQVLGGFGLLLGVMGLAVVLLRGVWERRGELALLRALGYRGRTLNGLVFAENALLLVFGLGAGLVAAALAVAPHLAGGGSVPWPRLAGLLGLVLVVGLGVAALAVTAALRAPIVTALRRE